MGRAITGPRMRVAMMRRTAPWPAAPRASVALSADSELMTSPAPNNVTTTPMPMRTFDGRVLSTAASRKAAMGAMRDAFTAGASEATSVTRTPTRRAVMTVSGLSTVPPAGMSKPKALSSPFSTPARPMPTTSPITDASRPVATASSSTDRSTWERDAPSARSRAICRVRWAMMIENVL